MGRGVRDGCLKQGLVMGIEVGAQGGCRVQRVGWVPGGAVGGSRALLGGEGRTSSQAVGQ